MQSLKCLTFDKTEKQVALTMQIEGFNTYRIMLQFCVWLGESSLQLQNYIFTLMDTSLLECSSNQILALSLVKFSFNIVYLQIATKQGGYEDLNPASVQNFHEHSSQICDAYVDKFLYNA